MKFFTILLIMCVFSVFSQDTTKIIESATNAGTFAEVSKDSSALFLLKIYNKDEENNYFNMLLHVGHVDTISGDYKYKSQLYLLALNGDKYNFELSFVYRFVQSSVHFASGNQKDSIFFLEVKDGKIKNKKIIGEEVFKFGYNDTGYRISKGGYLISGKTFFYTAIYYSRAPGVGNKNNSKIVFYKPDQFNSSIECFSESNSSKIIGHVSILESKYENNYLAFVVGTFMSDSTCNIFKGSINSTGDINPVQIKQKNTIKNNLQKKINNDLIYDLRGRIIPFHKLKNKSKVIFINKFLNKKIIYKK